MFSRFCASRSSLQRYRESPHKARIDHVAAALVARRYLDVVIAQHLHEWLQLTRYFDTRGIALPASVRAPEVQAYLAQRLPHGSASRRRVIRASARLFLETDQQGDFRRRIGGPPGPPVGAWFAVAVETYDLFLRRHRGLADRTVRKRAWQLGQFAEFLELMSRGV